MTTQLHSHFPLSFAEKSVEIGAAFELNLTYGCSSFTQRDTEVKTSLFSHTDTKDFTDNFHKTLFILKGDF